MRVWRTGVTGLAALLMMAAAPAPRPAGTPVVLQSQPGTPLDAAARALVAADAQQSPGTEDRSLILVGSARLGTATDRPALFVQLQSPRDCGSAGCSTTVYAWIGGGWRKVLDGTSGQLSVASTRTRGMADLLTDSTRYVWTGTAYRDARPAPSVDLRPRQPRR